MDYNNNKGKLIGLGRSAEVFLWQSDRVLKLFFKDIPITDIEYEARATRAAHQVNLPVPVVDEVIELDGRHGIVFERVEGPLLDTLMLTKPWKVPQLAALMADLHLKIHSCKLPELPSRQEYLRTTIQKLNVLPHDFKETLLVLLQTLPDSDNLCHNDFHPQNIIMSPRGPIIIDWANAKRGHRLSDVARTSLLLRVGTPPNCNVVSRRLHTMGGSIVFWFYLKQYTKQEKYSKAEMDKWLILVAAARLSERISEEKKCLMDSVRKGLIHVNIR